MHSEISGKRTAVLGAALIAVGLLFNRRFIEATLIPDHRIVAPQYLAVIYSVELLAIATGAWLLIKRPPVRLPGRTEAGLLVLSISLAFVLLEVAARLWLNYLATPEQRDRYVLFTDIKPADYAWTPHPYLTYYPTPNYRKGRTAHNSLGYRGDEFPLKKPSGVYRIVVLGGSSTYDVAIEDNAATFTAQLQRLLREDYGHQNVQLINAGVPGYNSWEMLVNLEFRVLDLNPDLVILYEGTNDVHARLVEPSVYRGDDLGRRQVWQAPPVALWEHSALLRIASRMMNITRQVSLDDFVSSPTYLSWPFEYRLSEDNLDPAAILKENPPVYVRRNYENMIAVAREHGIAVMLSTWAYSPYRHDYVSEAYYQQGLKENNEVVKEVAATYQVPLFDFAAVMPQDPKYWADGRHSTEAGALLKATLFAKFIDAHGLISNSEACTKPSGQCSETTP